MAVKKGETAELSAKWWKAAQPKGLASGVRLELALRAHEASVAGFEKQRDGDHHKGALETLEAIKESMAKVIAEAGKAKKSDELDWTVAALKKIDFAKETKLLDAKLRKEDEDNDDEVDASALKDPATFAKLLRKSLNKIKDEPRNWGFLVGKKPIEHRLLVHGSKQGRAMAMAAAKELGQRPKLSFGTAIRDPEDSSTLILTVHGAMLAGLATRCKKMLLKMKPQTISEVVLMVDGQIVPESYDPDDVDLDDEDEGAGAQIENPALEVLHGRIAAIGPRVAAVMAAQPGFKDRLQTSIDALMAAMGAEDVAKAGPMIGKLEEVIARLEQMEGGDRRVPLGTVAFAKLRLEWESTKKSVAGEIAKLKTAAAAAYDGDPLIDALDNLDGVVARFNEGLGDRLDDLASADDATKRRDAAVAATAIADSYLSHIDSDPLIGLIEINPIGPIAISAPLETTLEKIRNALAAVSA